MTPTATVEMKSSSRQRHPW